jgi:hypothetical protein
MFIESKLEEKLQKCVVASTLWIQTI